MFGCICSECLLPYEAARWSAPWLCEGCASARIRFEESARAAAAFNRWLSVQDECAVGA